MARVPTEEIERLKREVSVKQLVEARGVKLKAHGKNLIGLCPLHDDREPSLVVTPSKNLWNCLGACRSGGTAIDWVMKCHGVGFRHAIELMRAALPSLDAESAPSRPVKASSVKRLPPPVDPSADDREVLRQVVDYYHEQLKQSPEAIEYLNARGLRSPQAIEHFKLGFANRTLGYRLPDKDRKAGEEIRGQLQKLGIFRDSGHEHFNGSIVFPVFDQVGNVTEIYGRKISPRLRKGTQVHTYLPGPHRGVWNVGALDESKRVILCESVIDALTFWCHGFKNVTTSYGINGFTPELMQAFEQKGTEHVLIAYDRDDAGDRAAAELAEQLLVAGIGVSRIQLPRGMDVNEYALKVELPAKSLAIVVERAAVIGVPQKIEPSPPDPSAPAALPPAAVAEPRPARPDLEVELLDDEVIARVDDRRYRIRGLSQNLSHGQLRVTVHAVKLDPRTGEIEPGRGYFLDRIDLCAFTQRARYVKQASLELAVSEAIIKRDVGRLLSELERLQDQQICETLKPKEPEAAELTNDETLAALDLLKDPRLVDRILEDFERCGVVGEKTNKLIGYLAAVSRKLEQPLGIVIQSSSAAGKSSLMEAVLAMVPEEDRVQYSAMTGQSLFYMSETQLKHKILAIVEEEGASSASYALKLLQSEGELTMASTGKDPQSGKLTTEEYRVEGPVMIMLTTTAIEVDEELMNRCLVLTVDEDRDQTRAIHRLQRESQTLDGLLRRRDSKSTRTVHRNAQRLLRPLLVANPYAESLTFLDDRTRTRRDHVKYLTLIRTIALLWQYQRPIMKREHAGESVEYIEVTLDDIRLANRLAHEVLGRSLDELSPQTRRLLQAAHELVDAGASRQGVGRTDFRFTRREVRERTGWTDFQVRTHLDKLVTLEYLLVHRGGRGQQFVYELLYGGEGKAGEPFLMGLIDPDRLESSGYDPNYEHRNGDYEPPSSPQRVSNEPTSRSPFVQQKSNADSDFEQQVRVAAENAPLETKINSRRVVGGRAEPARL